MQAECRTESHQAGDFANREFNHYYDEFVKAGSSKDDWRMDACTSLEDWVDKDKSSKIVKNTPNSSKEMYKPQFNEDGVDVSQEPKQNSHQPSTPPPSAPSPAVPSIINSPSVILSPANHPAFPLMCILGPLTIVPTK